MSGQLLTTGKAAKLCWVEPDTVLKWIKKGRLPATRTAGGHYRIDERSLAPFLPSAAKGPDQNPAESPARPLRCWEYMSAGGSVREECKQCVVYQVRAAWCFEVLNLACGAGHAKRFCATSCQDCVYYRRASGMATNVLVVTTDSALIEQLQTPGNERVAFRFARNAYEASSLVAEFRPAFAVVDQDLVSAGEGEFLDCLVNDARVPGLRIILGVSKNMGGRVRNLRIAGVVTVIEKPFGPDRIADIIGNFPVEILPRDERSAQIRA